jgi:hypothetical protein
MEILCVHQSFPDSQVVLESGLSRGADTGWDVSNKGLKDREKSSAIYLTGRLCAMPAADAVGCINYEVF